MVSYQETEIKFFYSSLLLAAFRFHAIIQRMVLVFQTMLKHRLGVSTFWKLLRRKSVKVRPILNFKTIHTHLVSNFLISSSSKRPLPWSAHGLLINIDFPNLNKVFLFFESILIENAKSLDFSAHRSLIDCLYRMSWGRLACKSSDPLIGRWMQSIRCINVLQNWMSPSACSNMPLQRVERWRDRSIFNTLRYFSDFEVAVEDIALSLVGGTNSP